MNNNIARKINEQINSINDGNIVAESTLFDYNRTVPPVKIQRHFISSAKEDSTVSLSAYQISRERFVSGSSIEIPKLVNEKTIIDSECATYKKKVCGTNSKVKTFHHSQRKLQNKDLASSNEIKKYAPLKDNKVRKDSFKKPNEEKKSKVLNTVSTSDLRLNLDTVGTQLSLIENALPLNKLQSLKKNQETKTIKNSKRFVKKNIGCNSAKHSQLPIFSLDDKMKQYNPDEYTDHGNYFEENEEDCVKKVDENLFTSDFAKGVANMYNQSDNNSVMNLIENNQYCEYAEKKKLQKIREELQMWKHEYLLKSGRQYVDPTLETSCGDSNASTSYAVTNAASSYIPDNNDNNSAPRYEQLCVYFIYKFYTY
ncbi:uncharacterized protein LOC142331520 isoform X2 [Lycorma delicatula]